MRWLLLPLLLLAALLSGCASILRTPIPPAAALTLPAIPHIQGSRTWGDEVPVDVVAEFKRAMPNLPGFGVGPRRSASNAPVKFNILALSGGGPNGAFGAGVLTGWTARGDRPKFDLVTGVSAGALIAPFAYLGPRYDPQLREVWTQYETKELVTAQILPGLLGGDALADTGPLKELIAKYVTRQMMREIAAEYRKGRMLSIGTTNLDAKRPVVWNMGEIAIHDTLEALQLFRDVLLASASIPGAFPPVNIKVVVDGQLYDEMHVDGGVTRQVFVAPVNVPYEAFNRFYATVPDRTLWRIQNGKMNPEYSAVTQQTIPIAATSIQTVLINQHKGDVYRIYRMSEDAGVAFNMLAIPDEFSGRPKQVFDPEFQALLFDEGVRIGRRGGPWQHQPPELGPTRKAAAAR